MRHREKSISKVTLWQIGSKFLLQGIGFFTVPVFTRLLTPQDFGLASVYMTWVSLFSIVVGLQTHGSIGIARIKIPEQEFNRYLSSILTISVLNFLLLLVFGYVLKERLVSLTGFGGDLLLMMGMQGFCSFCVNFVSAEFVQTRRVEANTIVSLLIVVSTIILSLYCIQLLPDRKYLGKILGSFIPYCFAGLTIVLFVFFRGRCFYNSYYWRFCLRLTLPLILHGAGGLILAQSDRVMLKNMFSDAAAGVYAVVYNLSSVVNIIWVAFNTSWVPFYYDYKKSNDAQKIREHSAGYMWTFTIISAGFLLCVPEVFKLLAPEAYWSGLMYMPLVVLGYYFNFLYSFPANYEFYHEQTKMVAVGTVLTAFFNIALNFFLIPRYGGFGAAIATLIGFMGLFLFHHLIARYCIKKDRYEYRFAFYLTGLVPACIAVAFYYLFMDLWYLRWGFAVVLGCALLLRFVRRRSIF